MKDQECGCSGFGSKAKLSPIAFGIAAGVLCGLSLMFLAWFVAAGAYSDAEIVRWSEYLRGYSASFVGGLIGFCWGLLKGFIGGFLFGWFYNLALCCCGCCYRCKSKTEVEKNKPIKKN